VLEWIEEKWGFDRDLVESYAIGVLPVPRPPCPAPFSLLLSFDP
jgi:hypothetical protein